MRRKCFLLLLIVLLFACKKEQATLLPPAGKVAETTATETAAMATTAPKPVAAQPTVAPTTGAATAQSLPRMIIRTAQLTLIVSDTGSALEKLTHAVEAYGGYVNDSKVWRDDQQLRATLSIRVPADKLTQTLVTLRHLAVRVQSESSSGEDVSQEYVDLQSELRNQQAAETELRILLSTVRERARKAEDILEVYEKLTEIRGDIEKTKGRIQYLSQMSAMATINVELMPDAIAKPVVEPGWQPVAVAKDAARSLTNALKAMATVGIWIVIYILPIVALFVIVAYAIVRVARLRRAA